jgi:1-acyl-sn-glycerol-3-phosphate acyltransferase
MDRCWRVAATAWCFACFGLGGLLLRLTVFPLLVIAVRAPSRRATVARAVVHRSFRAFISMMRAVGVISYEFHGTEKLRRTGLLILANHPSLIDVVFLMALVEGADCIVKAALASNPFTRGPVRAAGLVCNDAGPALVDACIASLLAGHNLIVFPEGTRTPLNGHVRLQRGAAYVAVRAQVNVTPVRIRVTPPTLAKGQKWWQVPVRRPHFVIEVGDDIDVHPYTDRCRSEALAARHLTEHLAHYFFPETARAAA